MTNHIQCDVLCVGAGGAGLVAAVTAAEAGASVVAISKGPYGCGNTRIAGGLVLSPNISPKDSPDALMRDMLVGGEFLNDQALLDKYCENAHMGAALMEEFGLIFFRKTSGEPAPLPVGLGGHSMPRSLSGYSEGIPIGTALRGSAARAGIRILDETMSLHLLKNDRAVTGAFCLDRLSGETVSISAKQTILATGGLGWLFYPHTSNMRTMTGDGYALALEAGAQLVDMEQQQFIPFALTHPESMIGIICGEPAIAGPYGRLVDKDGRDILKSVRMKTRAEASAAIALAKERGGATEHGGALLDLSPNLKKVIGEKMLEFLKRTQPAMIDGIRRAYGSDAAMGKVPWDVFPTAHYQMGGIRVHTDCRVRDVDNLFAVGEVAGGLHGGNRLGSTALAELFVFGKMAGEQAAGAAQETKAPSTDFAEIEERRSQVESLLGKSGNSHPLKLKRKLQSILWENVGPIRDSSRLQSALDQIADLNTLQADLTVPGHRVFNTSWIDALELKQMLIIGEAIAQSAAARKESRGGQVRLDYPERDNENPPKNVIVRAEGGTLRADTEDVDLSRYGLNTKGGPNRIRDRIQFVILSLLPENVQAKILNARLDLGDDV
jgi:succinate dehydrogenase/fumarate reductase flavoprotein subunit